VNKPVETPIANPLRPPDVAPLLATVKKPPKVNQPSKVTPKSKWWRKKLKGKKLRPFF